MGSGQLCTEVVMQPNTTSLEDLEDLEEAMAVVAAKGAAVAPVGKVMVEETAALVQVAVQALVRA